MRILGPQGPTVADGLEVDPMQHIFSNLPPRGPLNKQGFSVQSLSVLLCGLGLSGSDLNLNKVCFQTGAFH